LAIARLQDRQSVTAERLVDHYSWTAASYSPARLVAGLRRSGFGHYLGVTTNVDAPDPSPYDGQGRVDIDGCPGWQYLPFESNAEGGGPITVKAEGPEGVTVTFSVPTYVSRGDELGEITRLVIRARVRMERSAGVGG
jgi:hypothetical protein